VCWRSSGHQYCSGKATYSLEDFRYVCLTNLMANALGVAVDSQWKTIQDFIDYVKKNPGVKYAHPELAHRPI